MPRTRTKSYPGSITKRGASWRVRLCVGGVYHRFTVRGTKTAAQNFATTKHAELAGDHTRADAGLPGPVHFAELVAEFTAYELPTLSEGTRISYGNSFKAFDAYFGDKLGDPLVRDIRRSHVATFLEWRRTYRVGDENGTAGVSLHTVARDRRVLHRLFNYAIMKDHLDANPSQMVRAPKADPRNPPILTNDQLDALLDAAAPNPMLHTFVVVLADAGVRAYSEALQLRWEDVDLAGGFLNLRSEPGRRTKSGKSRSVPLTARLRAALQDHAARFRLALYDGARSPFVFHHTHTTRSAVAGARITDLRASFDHAKQTAKLPAAFRPHDLRHRRVTTWLAEGKNPVHVKEALGHASLATTMGYTHLLPEHLRALVEEQGGAPAASAKSG
jgi:site-specific recombinase XerD